MSYTTSCIEILEYYNYQHYLIFQPSQQDTYLPYHVQINKHL